MKVLHISTYDMGGAGIAATRIHQALLKYGINSKLLCLQKESKDVKQIYRWEKNVNNSYYSRLFRKLNILKSNSKKNLELLNQLGGEYEIFSFPYTDYDLLKHPLVKEADVIHLHWVSNFLDYKSFFSHNATPIVWTMHDLNPILGGFHYENDIAANFQFVNLENQLRHQKKSLISLQRIKFVGVSDWSTSKIKEYLGDETDATTIHYPLDFSKFKSVAKPVAKEALGLDLNKIIIGIGAQHLSNKRKGYSVLSEAFELLTETEKEGIQIISFGSPNNADSKLENILFFDTIDNKVFHSLIYSAMDFFIMPSLEEAHGLTGVEALCCGTPLIGSEVGGIKDYLQDEVNGLFFKPGNALDLSSKIRKLINEKEFKGRLTVNARNSIEKLFDEASIAQKYLYIYKELA